MQRSYNMNKILKSIFLVILIFLIFASLSACKQEHKHIPSDEVTENVVDPACDEDGSYDLVLYCTDCGEEIARVTHVIESTGHTSSETVMENEIAPTCSEVGEYEEVTYCDVCGDELSRETVFLNVIDHIPAEGVEENIVPPVCKNDGSCDLVVKCSMCETELSRTTESVPAIGHDWLGEEKCKNCGIAYTVGESLQMTLSEDGTYYIISGIGPFRGTELVMPSEYNGLPVKEIADYAFKDCDWIVRATIPASVTRLGYSAAMGCTALEELIIEDTKNWQLYDGQENPSIFSIPAFILIDTSFYFDKLIGGDQFALVKNVKS